MGLVPRDNELCLHHCSISASIDMADDCLDCEVLSKVSQNESPFDASDPDEEETSPVGIISSISCVNHSTILSFADAISGLFER